jgi:hypothetical protein
LEVEAAVSEAAVLGEVAGERRSGMSCSKAELTLRLPSRQILSVKVGLCSDNRAPEVGKYAYLLKCRRYSFLGRSTAEFQTISPQVSPDNNIHSGRSRINYRTNLPTPVPEWRDMARLGPNYHYHELN